MSRKGEEVLAIQQNAYNKLTSSPTRGLHKLPEGTMVEDASNLWPFLWLPSTGRLFEAPSKLTQGQPCSLSLTLRSILNLDSPSQRLSMLLDSLCSGFLSRTLPALGLSLLLDSHSQGLSLLLDSQGQPSLSLSFSRTLPALGIWLP